MLNKNKPFGEVHGHAPYQYMQDNKFFNSQGYQVSESGELIEKVMPQEATPLDMAKIAVADEPVIDPETNAAPELGEGSAAIQESTDEAQEEPEPDKRSLLIKQYDETLTVPIIKEKLAAMNVDIPKDALKPDLLAILVDEELA